MILRASTRPHGETSAPAQQISAEADTYDDAVDALRRQVPEGWDLLHISRD